MRAIVLSDIHFDYLGNSFLAFQKEKAIGLLEKNVDCVLLCGDNAEMTINLLNHKKLFEILRKKFQCPIGFVVGNHDLWGRKEIPSEVLLHETFRDLAKEFNLIYLEKENMKIKDFTIAGTYGHYDYSFGNENEFVSRKNFTSGELLVGKKIYLWNDKRLMDWQGKSDEEISGKLVRGLVQRTKNANKKKIITISHAIPHKESNGYSNSVKQDFFGAYSGTSKLGDVIKQVKPIYHFCGHTHLPADSKIGETKVINIGTDYEDFKYFFLDTKKNIEGRFSIGW